MVKKPLSGPRTFLPNRSTRTANWELSSPIKASYKPYNKHSRWTGAYHRVRRSVGRESDRFEPLLFLAKAGGWRILASALRLAEVFEGFNLAIMGIGIEWV